MFTSVKFFYYEHTEKSMLEILLSVSLPILSHITRQSIACFAEFPPYVFTAFMITYALSLLIHSMWMDKKYLQSGARGSIVLYTLTFAACVFYYRYRQNSFYFAILWSLHAVPSAVFWPAAYRIFNREKRHRLALTIWSLQGNVGDAIGCNFQVMKAIDDKSIVIAVMCALLVLLCLVSFPKTEDMQSFFIDDHSQGHDHYNHYKLFIILCASASIKCVTYSSSNWLPFLHMRYEFYVCFGMIGTVFAGLITEKYKNTSTIFVYSCVMFSFGIATSFLYSFLWHNSFFICAFGFVSAFVNTIVSICLCTDLADRTKRYARTTSIIDGGATIVSAIVQLSAPKNFALVQLCSSISLLISSIVVKYIEC